MLAFALRNVSLVGIIRVMVFLKPYILSIAIGTKGEGRRFLREKRLSGALYMSQGLRITNAAS